MSNAARPAPGKERTCPHCRATVLHSASICPACQHSLRFDSHGTSRALPAISALSIEGTIRHPNVGEAWEYSMVLSIRNDRGEEINRHIVGVGALNPDEYRTFTVAVTVTKPAGAESTTRS
ncbi:MAG: hypothetical protein ACR2GG_05035 [Gemmatimonadaceae bacterium]